MACAQFTESPCASVSRIPDLQGITPLNSRKPPGATRTIQMTARADFLPSRSPSRTKPLLGGWRTYSELIIPCQGLFSNPAREGSGRQANPTRSQARNRHCASPQSREAKYAGFTRLPCLRMRLISIPLVCDYLRGGTLSCQPVRDSGAISLIRETLHTFHCVSDADFPNRTLSACPLA